MLIMLETSRAEASHHATTRTLQRAEEFARLYGVGSLSQQTMLELMGLSQRNDRSPPLVFESTPSSRPNAIADAWAHSMVAAMRIVNELESRVFVVDSLTGVDAE